MQIGDEQNPAMRTLIGELPEWWMKNGEEAELNYKEEYKMDNPEDSIYWGVRWFISFQALIRQMHDGRFCLLIHFYINITFIVCTVSIFF